MKKASHIMDIVDRKANQAFTHEDKIILSTDQQSNLIYIYKSYVQNYGKEEVENLIYIYNYQNNIVNTKPATTIPKLILEAESKQEGFFSLEQRPQTYYINAKYKFVVSNA